MYTTDIQDSGTVSATDEERLPPGGFSLRHGFPSWFGRGTRKPTERVNSESLQTPVRGSRSGAGLGSPESGTASSVSPASGKRSVHGELPRRKSNVGMYEVLRYIRSTFDDGDILDLIPLAAAGNPGAWHAWRTHRIKSGNIQVSVDSKERSNWHDGLSDDGSTTSSEVRAPEGYQRLAGGTSTLSTARRPGEWNWDGVWEFRVKKGVDASVSDAVLFGNTPVDDLFRFLHIQDDEIQSIRENIKRSVEHIGGESQKKGNEIPNY